MDRLSVPGPDRDLLIVRDQGGREIGRVSIPPYPAQTHISLHRDHEPEPVALLVFGRIGVRAASLQMRRPNPDGTSTNVDYVLID